MELRALTRIKGFSYYPARNRGSDLVWPVVKDFLHKAPGVLDIVKEFHRSTPSLKMMYENLIKFERKAAPKPTDVAHQKAVDLARYMFRPKEPLRLTKICDIKSSDLPRDTNPGYPYYYEGFRRKDECFDLARVDAEQALNMILTGKSCTTYPSMMFAKGKVSRRDEPKSRIVNCKSLRSLLLEMSFTKELWKQQKQGGTPAAYDITPYRAGYTRVSKFLSLHNLNKHPELSFLNGDFSKYDTGSAPWATIEAYRIVESYFDFGTFSDGTSNPNPEGYRRLLRYLERDHIHTKLLMPDGYMYQKHIGDDSGSTFFQLIQNIKTYIICQSAYYEQTGHFSPYIKVLGDDSLVVCLAKIDLPRYAAYIEKTYGIELNLEKTNYAKDLDSASFLGRYFDGRATRRDLVDVVLSMLYPESTEDDECYLAQRIVAFWYETGGGKGQVNFFLTFLWLKIPARIREALSTMTNWPKRLMKKFTLLGIPVPRVELPDPITLYCLTNTPDYTKIDIKDIAVPYDV